MNGGEGGWTNFDGEEMVWLAGRDVLGNVLDGSGLVRRRFGAWVITAADVIVKNMNSAVGKRLWNSCMLRRLRISSALFKHRRSGGHGTICMGKFAKRHR